MNNDNTGVLYSCNKDNSSILNSRTGIGKFKEDIVNAVYQMEDKLTNCTNGLEAQIKSRNEIFDSRIIHLEEELNKISKQVYEINSKTEKANEMHKLEKKNNELIVINEIRLTNLSKDLSSACYKYDKIFLDNLVLPGIIGDFCRFKNVKECLDNILTQLANLNLFKERIGNEVKGIKEKCESTIRQVNGHIDQIKKNCATTVSLELFDDQINQKIQNFNDLISQVQIENNKYAISLKDNSQLLQKDLIKLKETKESMESNNNHFLKECNDKIINTTEHFNHIKTQFNKMSRQFSEVAEFIKDVRFKKNINAEVTKNDIKKLASNLFGDEYPESININESFMLKSYHQTELENDILNEKENNTTQIIKEIDQPKKSKYTLDTSNTSIIQSISNIPNKKNKLPKKIKKKKLIILSKGTNESLNKIEKKSKSQDKHNILLLNQDSQLLKQSKRSLHDLNLNAQFISRLNKAKLTKISSNFKRYEPSSDCHNDDIINL